MLVTTSLDNVKRWNTISVNIPKGILLRLSRRLSDVIHETETEDPTETILQIHMVAFFRKKTDMKLPEVKSSEKWTTEVKSSENKRLK